MIDCENEVYTRIVRMLREEFPGINVAGEYTKTPSSFPHVSITQSDNSTIADKQDTSGKCFRKFPFFYQAYCIIQNDPFRNVSAYAVLQGRYQ